MSVQVTFTAALLAGVAAALGVFALASSAGPTPANRLLAGNRPPAAAGRIALPAAPAWLAMRLERAGWQAGTGRFLVLAGGAAALLALVGLGTGRILAGAGGAGIVPPLLGAAAGPGIALHVVARAAAARRRRLLAELAPTLDLVGIELSAGASPLGALATVTRRGDGPLARELRSLLAAAALSTDRGADARLLELGERLDLPPLVSLATVLATSRDYGSGAARGIRAIAIDLRRARRRELIASSRRALSRILVPAALGVLLPFMAVLLFPAVVALSASFR